MQEKYDGACEEYRGPRNVAEKREEEEEKIGVNIPKNAELMKKAWKQEEERLKWEQSVAKGAVTDDKPGETTIDIKKIPTVKQSYDHVLSKDEKAFLPEIEEEKKRQKELQMMVRKRREVEKDLRQQKIQELQNKRKKVDQ